jgi:serine/threonine-protein kinase RsbW
MLRLSRSRDIARWCLLKSAESRTVKLDIASRFEMLDMVQTVLMHLAGMLGFEEDATHYMSVAVRESVVNAIKHGNQLDETKRVAISFTIHAAALEVEVQDQGAGFDPALVPDPVAEENLLKAYGRGIFFMRSFMDDVSYAFPPGGGTVVTMTKTKKG